MSRTGRTIWDSLKNRQEAWSLLAGCGSVFLGAWWLRRFPFAPGASLSDQVQLASGFLALSFAILALVRFRGTRDRLPLILGCGFVIIGFTLVSSSAVFFRVSDHGGNLRDPRAWVIDRTLLAVLLVAALMVEQWIPTAPNPRRETALALVVIVALTILLSTAHRHLPADLIAQPRGVFPRPGNLFPAGLFLVTAIGYHRRLKRASASSPFDRALYVAAALSLACCLAASQSERSLDAPFALAEMLQLGSYAVLLGGAFRDNVRLFEEVRCLAMTDPLTGLANYRRLMDALDAEVQRSRRTGRHFALLLFDLDGLKKINDSHGHLVGSKALCRVAQVMRGNSRAIDIAARYGGDEFALILPETGIKAAQEVARRICDSVAQDQELPPISVSVGVALYARDGETLDALLGAADRGLYKTREHSGQKLPAAL